MKHRASRTADDLSLFCSDHRNVSAELDQHDTPLWAADFIVTQKFAHLKTGDMVLEPGCGAGAFLRALPSDVSVLAVELDPQRAAEARERSGREVVIGDIRTVALPERLDAVIGNPPWDLAILDSILERARPLMPTGAKAGFFLPAYAFQTEGRLLRYNRDWSIVCENVPRRLWDGLKHPAVYAEFIADQKCLLVGFLLYGELAAVRALPERYRDELTKPAGGLWFGAIRQALEERGGELTLQGIYDAIEGRQPTPNPFWRQQIRKIAYQRLQRVGDDRFRMPLAA